MKPAKIILITCVFVIASCSSLESSKEHRLTFDLLEGVTINHRKVSVPDAVREAVGKTVIIEGDLRFDQQHGDYIMTRRWQKILTARHIVRCEFEDEVPEDSSHAVVAGLFVCDVKFDEYGNLSRIYYLRDAHVLKSSRSHSQAE